VNLSAAIDQALKAYMDHSRVVLNGDASLDISFLVQPFGVMQQPQQMMAQMALQQNGGAPGAAIAPMLQNGQPDLAMVEVDEDGKKKRKKRAYKPRDPNAPKRPLTAYFRYLGEMRPRIQQEMTQNPDQFAATGKPGDIAKVATDRWNALTQDQQAPYKAAYQAELKNYEIAIAAYKAAGGAVDDTTVDTSAVAAGAGAEKPVVPAVAAKADSDDSDDSSDDEEAAAAPPPPPPATAPKKSAMKKGRQPAQPASATIPTPVFNTVNDTAASAQLQEEAKSSSPSKKRKAADTTESDGSKKKRGRKSKADEVVPAPDPVAVAPPASSPPTESASGKKPKKDKKKKKSGD
jgi:hypothetical protein